MIKCAFLLCLRQLPIFAYKIAMQFIKNWCLFFYSVVYNNPDHWFFFPKDNMIKIQLILYEYIEWNMNTRRNRWRNFISILRKQKTSVDELTTLFRFNSNWNIKISNELLILTTKHIELVTTSLFFQ